MERDCMKLYCRKKYAREHLFTNWRKFRVCNTVTHASEMRDKVLFGDMTPVPQFHVLLGARRVKSHSKMGKGGRTEIWPGDLYYRKSIIFPIRSSVPIFRGRHFSFSSFSSDLRRLWLTPSPGTIHHPPFRALHSVLSRTFKSTGTLSRVLFKLENLVDLVSTSTSSLVFIANAHRRT